MNKLQPFEEQIEAEIQEALKHLPTVRDKAQYGETVTSIEKMKKLLELLRGGSTDSININVKMQWK